VVFPALHHYNEMNAASRPQELCPGK
jgi:hypothetical protein